MKNYLLFALLALISTNLFAYEDFDMDGVENKVDKCPNTLFSDLVDIRGCTIKSLVSKRELDLILGVSYGDSDYQTLKKTDTFATSVQVDYYYKNFSFQASTSYFDTAGSGYDDKGFYDSFLGAAYTFKAGDSLLASVGVGVILPTYDNSLNNNNADYMASANLSYSLDKINVFGGYSHTLVNDNDVAGIVSYQNASAVSGGLGYHFDEDLYASASYNSSDSVYVGVEDVQTASIYANYTIDEHWFAMFGYAYGLSDSASGNYVSFRLGYFF
jgi:hypothetical protein